MESALRYRLTLPQRAADGGAPLIVASHGCKQTAKDFAVGTRLDQCAAHYGAALLSTRNKVRRQTLPAAGIGCTGTSVA